MFIKLTRSGGRTYAQLAESFRDEHGRPRQRTLATLGRVYDRGGQLDKVHGSLLRARGRPVGVPWASRVRRRAAAGALRVGACARGRVGAQRAVARTLSRVAEFSPVVVVQISPPGLVELSS